jgi:hypothetical protein
VFLAGEYNQWGRGQIAMQRVFTQFGLRLPLSTFASVGKLQNRGERAPMDRSTRYCCQCLGCGVGDPSTRT